MGHKLELTYYYTQTGTIASKYTVNFESNGGSHIQALENIDEGTTINSPENPTYTGYTFDGWYKESTFENKWDFRIDVVNSNITLYAKWILMDENNNDKDQVEATTKTNKLGASNNLPKTGNNIILGSGILLLLGGSIIVIGGVAFLRKRNSYNN